MLSSNEEGVERRESRKTLITEEEGRETSRTGGRSGREGVAVSVTGHGEASQHMGCGYGGGWAVEEWRGGAGGRTGRKCGKGWRESGGGE